MSDIDASEARLRRIRYRAWHRGFREADLILGPFADRRLDTLSADQLDRLERLMDQPDQDLYDWITERSPAPAAFDDEVLAAVRNFRHQARAARPVGDGA